MNDDHSVVDETRDSTPAQPQRRSTANLSFGRRAAILAGLIVSVGASAASVGGAGIGQNPLLAEPDTTCCPHGIVAGN